MSNISRPFVTTDDPDRHIRCQDALQFALRDLITAATAAGWTEEEALSAIADLAEAHILEREIASDTASLNSILRKML